MKIRDEYVHGAWNQICDRSGFKVKNTGTRREWNHSVVRNKDWEARHPQDFLRAIPDHQAVEDPRPGAADGFTQGETTVDVDAFAGDTVIGVASTADMSVGDSIIIFMDNQIAHLSTIASFVDSVSVTINDPLTYKSSVDSLISVYSNVITEADL